MRDRLCPACRHPGLPTARRCLACGADLDNVDTVPLPLDAQGQQAPVGALWLDDLGGAVQSPTRAGGAPDRSDATAATARGNRPPPRAGRVPTPAFVTGAPAASTAPPPAASPAPPAATSPATTGAEKDARRATVRRERLASAPPARVRDVLVVDSDDTARHQLCSLLLTFGFGLRSAASVAEAAAWVTAQPFVAAFIGMPAVAEEGEALELFERLRGAHPAEPAPLLVLVAAQWRPMDRVRAELVGCRATLRKPVSRSSVARVLDSQGVALPCDARRS